jgi:hypothetical protein
MDFLVIHAAGEFIARSATKTAGEVAEVIADRWGLDIESIGKATTDDIAANLGQITEIDQDV